MNSFLYEEEPTLIEETLQLLNKDISLFDYLYNHYTKEYYLWKWMSSVFTEYKKEQQNYQRKNDINQIQNKKTTFAKLYSQFQLFQSFFKENILNSLKLTPPSPSSFIPSWIPQFQKNDNNPIYSLVTPPSSFLNYSSVSFIPEEEESNKIFEKNSIISQNMYHHHISNNVINNENNHHHISNNIINNENNHYHDSHNINSNNNNNDNNNSNTTISIPITHPLNTIKKNKPTSIQYYQYLPLLKSNLNIINNTGTTPNATTLEKIKVKELHSTFSSGKNLKKISHSISLPNLYSSKEKEKLESNRRTQGKGENIRNYGRSDQEIWDHDGRRFNADSNNYNRDKDKNENCNEKGNNGNDHSYRNQSDDEVENGYNYDHNHDQNHDKSISLYSIQRQLLQDQQTLKKLQKKLKNLRKENQDLLDQLLMKRKIKDDNKEVKEKGNEREKGKIIRKQRITNKEIKKENTRNSSHYLENSTTITTSIPSSHRNQNLLTQYTLQKIKIIK